MRIRSDLSASFRPEIVLQLEFLESTDTDHLRHSKFVDLREDKDARTVVKGVSSP
jgi:bifunctional non-homologous end joining protein LigD